MWLQHPKFPMQKTVFARVVLTAALLFSGSAVYADKGFSGGVSPSRFELVSKPGDVVRRSIKIYNLGARPTQFKVRTVDWDYSVDGQISFQDELAANSCREWVALERHKISVVPDPQRPRNFRFEIQIPEDAPAQECRFGLMMEGLADTHTAQFADGQVSLPVAGRIAVIVYLGIGGVEPEISIGQLSVRQVNNRQLPVLQVRNEGQAHGRLDADLIANTDDGKRLPLTIATSPILPGQTRFLTLSPLAGTELRYPLTVKGKIYSDDDSTDIEATLRAPEEGFLASH